MSKIVKGKNVTPSCSYCKHGNISPDNETVLCIKKGVVDKEYYCRKFSYDPLKRQPERPRKIPKDFNPDDFEI